MVAKARLKPASSAEMIERPDMRLLADALVDQHVRIDRHADGEHDAGDAGQGQRRAEQHHRGEDERDMAPRSARSAKTPNMP